MSKKILIIGNTTKAYALAKKMSETHVVYVAPGSATIAEFATCVDIREDSVIEILEFVMENDIDLTIPVSLLSLKSDLVDVFTKNNLQIFAPTANSAKYVFDKALLKKTMYKLRIPTPKFGIFEKQNMVSDYIKNLKNPFVLKTNESSSAVILTSSIAAKPVLDSFFAQGPQKVIIEDYIWGTPFAFYAITDGYKALPIGSSIIYKHSLEGDGGQLTSGMGACSPNYKLTNQNEYFLMDNVIYPLLENLEMEGTPYLGIIAVNGILTEEGNLQVLGIDSFMQDSDADAVLSLLDTDLYQLFNSCILGVFSDEVEFIEQKELAATSLVLTCKNKENIQNTIEGLDMLEEQTIVSFWPSVTKNKYLEFEANTGGVLVLTALTRTPSTSREKVYEEAECIKFKGLSYRKDICKPLRTSI